MTKPKRAPNGAARSIHHKGASRCLDEGCDKFAPFCFSGSCVAQRKEKMNATPIVLQTTEDKYKLWIKSPLERLLNEEHTDFVIMLIALPMLERYLREKSGAKERLKLPPLFYVEFGNLFPELKQDKDRRTFWEVFRHGLAHQFMMNTESGTSARLDRKGPLVSYDSNVFTVNAPEFARRAMAQIESDFHTFEASSSRHHLFANVVFNGVSAITESVARATRQTNMPHI